MERNSDECERDVEEMKMAEYMEDHIGDEYSGMISGVMSYGFFVQLDNMIEGLVPVENFGEEFNYDKDLEILKVGSRVFKLGKKVLVRVGRASKDESQIDFDYVGDIDEEEKTKKKS